MENIIEVKDLCFEYEPGLNTINHISFHIQKGEYVAILGHNGSGKSTIAQLLIGLLEKSSGEFSRYSDHYVHRASQVFVTGLSLNLLQEYICLHEYRRILGCAMHGIHHICIFAH